MMRDKIEIIVREALQALGVEVGVVNIEHPADSSHGDYATNAALMYGKAKGVSPRMLAGELVEKILETSSDDIAKIEIAGPGFINFFLSDTTLESAILRRTALRKNEENEGRSFVKTGERVNVEFVSTNPTGELHIGHGRSAFFGDTLARVLALTGAEVTREFYINDSRESNQIRELGKTALGKGEQYKTPELVEKMAKLDFTGLSEEEAGVLLATAVQAGNRAFIEKELGVNFDVWYSEDAELRASGANTAMLALLKERNFTYEKDGALWLKTSEYGDDEDRVIVRSDGTVPYFLADIAYHQKKFDRGFQAVINVWGADHHGHIKRMQAVGRMLGWPARHCLSLNKDSQAMAGGQKAGTGADQPIVFIAQMVSLKEDGVSSKMSKRAGNVILLRDLVAEFGIDIVRWFFIEKALNTQMAFDMALAREKSEKNPVYYVQYAHARLSSVIEKAKARNAEILGSPGLPETGRTALPETKGFAELFKTPSARALAMKIAELPEVVADIAESYAVHSLTGYAVALATATNAFYRDVRIVTDDGVDTTALALALRAKETLAETLALLGISAPDRM
ncbi:MAG: arginine--tRNA ligase [Patescibacteria group bacterium]